MLLFVSFTLSSLSSSSSIYLSYSDSSEESNESRTSALIFATFSSSLTAGLPFFPLPPVAVPPLALLVYMAVTFGVLPIVPRVPVLFYDENLIHNQKLFILQLFNNLTSIRTILSMTTTLHNLRTDETLYILLQK
jgi:hypothetical protein